jgi:hypothetical protein
VCLATCSCRSTNVKETNQRLAGLCVWLLVAVDLLMLKRQTLVCLFNISRSTATSSQTHSPTSLWFVSLTLVDLQLQVARHTVLLVLGLSLTLVDLQLQVARHTVLLVLGLSLVGLSVWLLVAVDLLMLKRQTKD